MPLKPHAHGNLSLTRYATIRRCFVALSSGFCADPVYGVSPASGLEDISQHASIDIPGIVPHHSECCVAGWKQSTPLIGA